MDWYHSQTGTIGADDMSQSMVEVIPFNFFLKTVFLLNAIDINSIKFTMYDMHIKYVYVLLFE